MGEAILEMPCKLACRCRFRRIVDCHVFCPNGSDCFARHVGQEQTALDTMLSDYERAALYNTIHQTIHSKACAILPICIQTRNSINCGLIDDSVVYVPCFDAQRIHGNAQLPFVLCRPSAGLHYARRAQAIGMCVKYCRSAILCHSKSRLSTGRLENLLPEILVNPDLVSWLHVPVEGSCTT